MPLAGAVMAALVGGAAAAAPRDCAALIGQTLNGARVVSSAVASRPDAPAFCRVILESNPIPASQIGTELWLPLRDWTGRYVQLGTGGFAGTLPDVGMAAELRRGNAVAVTDTGHKGADGFDARWALGAPERVIDYGHRSLKVSAVAAKGMVQAFYGQAPRYSYFVGCSNGGRQALVAAQRYPEDWDGILAGAPALAWTEQLSSFAQIQKALRQPGGMIARSKLPAIQRAARAGDLRPERLGLTAPQAATLRSILRDFDARWAAAPGGWDQWIVNPDRAAQSQLTFAEQFFGEMVLGQPGWRVEDLTPEDLTRAGALAPVIDVADRRLSGFRQRGGKLLIYVGAADPVVSPGRVTGYFDSLDAGGFARLFVIPGMLHCQGGPEPNAFGQAPIAPPIRADGEHDVRRALELWVESGRAPRRLTAVKYVDDDPVKGVAARRTVMAHTAHRSRQPGGGRKREDAA